MSKRRKIFIGLTSEQLCGTSTYTRRLSYCSAAEFLQMSSIKENLEVESTAMQMVDSLLKDHEHIISSLRKHIRQCIETYNDRGRADFLAVLMERHEQMAWVLRSFLVRSFIEGENFEIEQAFPHLSQKDDLSFVTR